MIRANPKGAATSGIIPTNANASARSRIAIPIISTPAKSARPIAGRKPANAPIRAIATDKRDSSSLPHQYTQNRRVPGALLRMTAHLRDLLKDEAEDGGAVGAGAAKFRRGADGRGNFFATDLAESEALEEWSRGGRQENDFGDAVPAGPLQGLLHEAAAESATAGNPMTAGPGNAGGNQSKSSNGGMSHTLCAR